MCFGGCRPDSELAMFGPWIEMQGGTSKKCLWWRGHPRLRADPDRRRTGGNILLDLSGQHLAVGAGRKQVRPDGGGARGGPARRQALIRQCAQVEHFRLVHLTDLHACGISLVLPSLMEAPRSRPAVSREPR